MANNRSSEFSLYDDMIWRSRTDGKEKYPLLILQYTIFFLPKESIREMPDFAGFYVILLRKGFCRDPARSEV
jgi:hypothetical protein